MTLVEVLAALVLLGTILTSLTIARGRFLRQWAVADRRLRAIKAVDAMLSQWIAGSPDTIPAPGRGLLEDVPNTMWRTRRIQSAAARGLGAVIIRLEVWETVAGTGEPAQTPNAADDDSNSDEQNAAGIRKPLLTVEFLAHDSRRAVPAPAAIQPAGAQ
ncbi:MAG: hypothetical protein JWN24_3840 [Phycisphaerales bacterium]|nr:hypothetical protein [Phycisphaerales bacterium]